MANKVKATANVMVATLDNAINFYEGKSGVAQLVGSPLSEKVERLKALREELKAIP